MLLNVAKGGKNDLTILRCENGCVAGFQFFVRRFEMPSSAPVRILRQLKLQEEAAESANGFVKKPTKHATEQSLF